MSTKCGIYDLIQHVETGKIWRWFRDGRETPEGFVEFETDSPRDYAIMRRYRPYLDIAKERS